MKLIPPAAKRFRFLAILSTALIVACGILIYSLVSNDKEQPSPVEEIVMHASWPMGYSTFDELILPIAIGSLLLPWEIK